MQNTRFKIIKVLVQKDNCFVLLQYYRSDNKMDINLEEFYLKDLIHLSAKKSAVIYLFLFMLKTSSRTPSGTPREYGRKGASLEDG